MKIILEGAPESTNHLYRSVCSKGRAMVYMSQEGRALKEKYQWAVRAQWRRPSFDGGFIIEVRLYFPDKRRRDIDNYHKIALDSMKGIVFHDDCQIAEMTTKKMIDEKNPRIEIYIL